MVARAGGGQAYFPAFFQPCRRAVPCIAARRLDTRHTATHMHGYPSPRLHATSTIAMPVITLPDGSQRSYPQPLTVEQVATDIGPGLAKAALAGKVDGQLVDTSYLIETDAQLAIITARDPDGLE